LQNPTVIFIGVLDMTELKENNTEHSKLAFEEFKLYYESAEKVTERRLDTNRWNYSICTAILIATSLLLQWTISKPDYLIYSLAFIIFLSIIAIFYCTLWIRQINDFKYLNNSKFDILNRMAPNVSFSPTPSDIRVSYCPFEKEWKELEIKLNALELHRGSKILVLKSSTIEYIIPQSFRLLFAFIIFAGILMAVQNKIN
jgi:hypothetical protein